MGFWCTRRSRHFEGTNDKLKLSFEQRGRYDRTSSSFGKDPDVATGLVHRLGLAYKPVKWIKFSGLCRTRGLLVWGQRSHYVRDPADPRGPMWRFSCLQERVWADRRAHDA